MDICPPDSLLGDRSYGNKADLGTCVVTEDVHKDNLKTSLIEYLSEVDGVTLNQEGNDDDGDDDGDGIYSPFPEDILSPNVTEKDLDKMVTSSSQQLSQVLSQTKSLERISPIESTLFTFAHQEKINEDGETNKFVPFSRESFPGINDHENKEFREISVQTAEDGVSFTPNDSCPICELENENLKRKLIAFCLEYSYNEQKLDAMKKDISNGAVDHGFDGGNKKKRMVTSDEQIVPRSSSLVQNNERGKRGCRESSSRTIRLGLSRRVKRPPLHLLPKFQEASPTSLSELNSKTMKF